MIVLCFVVLSVLSVLCAVLVASVFFLLSVLCCAVLSVLCVVLLCCVCLCCDVAVLLCVQPRSPPKLPHATSKIAPPSPCRKKPPPIDSSTRCSHEREDISEGEDVVLCVCVCVCQEFCVCVDLHFSFIFFSVSLLATLSFVVSRFHSFLVVWCGVLVCVVGV